MIPGIDKLVDFLISIIEKLLPFWIIQQTQAGVHLSFGTFVRVLRPGIWFKFPLFDTIKFFEVVTTTMATPAQSLTTLDKQPIVFKGVIKYRIGVEDKDIKAYALDIVETQDALSDTAQGIIKELISTKTLAECSDNELDNKIEIKLRSAVRKWGIEIEKFTSTNNGKIYSLRLFNEIENIKDNE